MSTRNELDRLFSTLSREVNDNCDGYERLPGLHRPWELEQVLQPGSSYRVEDGGKTVEGTPLFTIYRERMEHGG